MKRWIAVSMIGMMVLMAGLVLSACGGSEDNGRRVAIPKSRLSAKSMDQMTPEERAELETEQREMMHAFWMWPEDAGPARDMDEDNAACTEALNSKRSLANANKLVQVTWIGRCMLDKGWQQNPDSKFSAG